jgi:hypothetical protein
MDKPAILKGLCELTGLREIPLVPLLEKDSRLSARDPINKYTHFAHTDQLRLLRRTTTHSELFNTAPRIGRFANLCRSVYWRACSRASAFCAWVKPGLIRSACCKCSIASGILPARPKAIPKL